MPGGKHDSSKTRVRPVFDQLWARGRDWLPELLDLPAGGCSEARISGGDLTLLERFWEPREKQLAPPLSLLSWMIRNGSALRESGQPVDSKRQRLMQGDPDTIEEALRLLRTDRGPKGWHLFEGPTSPDVFLVSRDALVVIEGKRTEPGPTTDTTWLVGRHQIWRHIDAAWEVRGRRAVYGFFIVENKPEVAGDDLSDVWQDACRSCLCTGALRTSFPHRSDEEAAAISRCFLGATTWRAVCEKFGLDWGKLPDVVGADTGRAEHDG